MADYSARSSALGYLYQVRFALYLLLTTVKEGAELFVESLDDIDVHVHKTPVELIQLKHNALKRSANLTDRSVDFWKTIRIWSDHTNLNKITPSTVLSLITTATVPNTSVLAHFLPNQQHDPRTIESKLMEIASENDENNNKKLKPAFKAFKSLSLDQRLRLLSAIQILHEQPDASDISGDIKAVIQAPSQFKEGIFQSLEGWLFDRIIKQLNSKTPESITKREVEEYIWHIGQQYHDDTLPTEFWEEIYIPPDDQTQQMMFVRQLKDIALSSPQINKAVKDYYQAFEQRSRWQRENLLRPSELENYEDRLIDEWERHRHWQKYDQSDEQSMIDAGKSIFRWADEARDMPKIRPRVDAPYVVRGSFHMLANNVPPKVFWHPLFINRLQSIIVASDPSSAWQQRPTEVANLLNPAFCSLLLRDAVRDYQKTINSGMPHILLVLVLPIVLHKSTRELLPKSVSTSMDVWIRNNQQVLVGFSERVRSLKQITREAITFALEKDVLQTLQDGNYKQTNKPFRKTKNMKDRFNQLDESEVEEITKQASFVGRWFAKIPAVSLIYSMWGIRP